MNGYLPSLSGLGRGIVLFVLGGMCGGLGFFAGLAAGWLLWV